MQKELFVKSIEALQQQIQHDRQFSEHLEKAFPNAFKANLLPDNHLLHNALIEVLKSAMNDTENWIEHFCWELDFGQENYRLEVKDNSKEIPMSNAGELWEYLNSKATCFWLKGLPKLKATNDVKEKWKQLPKNEAQRLHYLPPGPERAKLRSKTFQGVAQAMAEQWGSYACW